MKRIKVIGDMIQNQWAVVDAESEETIEGVTLVELEACVGEIPKVKLTILCPETEIHSKTEKKDGK